MNRMWEQSGLAIIDPSHSYLGTVYTVLSLRQSRLLLKDVLYPDWKTISGVYSGQRSNYRYNYIIVVC